MALACGPQLGSVAGASSHIAVWWPRVNAAAGWVHQVAGGGDGGAQPNRVQAVFRVVQDDAGEELAAFGVAERLRCADVAAVLEDGGRDGGDDPWAVLAGQVRMNWVTKCRLLELARFGVGRYAAG